ncbi:MAG TPA: HIT domain-containing protein [Candidatus Nanoarchaeia archaeon]|nr:HIT domain-containing protein [Candidatus Nanoarchaeia archaeon]
MKDCVFCKIVNNKIDNFCIHEDDVIKVFLVINPISKGHLLVIPKKHFEDIFEAPEEVLNKIMQICKEMSSLCKKKLGATGVNILNASGKDAQQSIFHLHFHVVPRYKNDSLDLWFHGKPKENKKDINEMYKKLIS